jgi:hypothetical protein
MAGSSLKPPKPELSETFRALNLSSPTSQRFAELVRSLEVMQKHAPLFEGVQRFADHWRAQRQERSKPQPKPKPKLPTPKEGSDLAIAIGRVSAHYPTGKGATHKVMLRAINDGLSEEEQTTERTLRRALNTSTDTGQATGQKLAKLILANLGQP